MKVLGQILRWSALIFGALLFIATVAVAVYTHTDGFRELLRQQALAALNSTIRGRLDVDRVEGSVWGNLSLINFRVAYGEKEIARVPRLQIQHSLIPLLWGDIRIFRLHASEPQLWLAQNQEGVWNIVEAFAPVDPKPAQPSKLLVAVNALELERGRMDIHLANQRKYSAADLAVRGRVGVQPAGIAVHFDRVSGRAAGDNLPELRIDGVLAYQNQDAPESLEFKDFKLETGASILKATGKIADLHAPITQARLTLVKLAPADVARFIPRWPVKTDIFGNIDFRGPLGGLDGSFSLAAAGGTVVGNFAADVSGAAPLYRGGIRVTELNIAELLQRNDLGGIMGGVVQLRGHGFALTGIEASAELTARAAEVYGWRLGGLSATAELRERVARVNGRIQGELGNAQWQGRMALKERNDYEIGFSASHLDVRRLLRRPEGIEGKLNLDGTITGSGLTLAGASARARINVLRSQLRGIEIDEGRVVASLAEQRIRIADASLRAGDAILSARGDLGIDPKQQGGLEYRVRVGELSPWLALLGQEASGAMAITGAATGTVAALKTQGKLTLRSLSFQGVTVQTGVVAYDLAYATAQPAPEGVVSFNLGGVARGYRLEELQGTVKVFPKLPYAFDVDARARDTQRRLHTVTAAVQYAPSRIAARVTNLTLGLPDGTWKLAQPAAIAQQGNDFHISQLAMRNNDRSVSVDGQFSLTGSQALRISLDRVPIDTVRGFYANIPDITGNISGQSELTGTAAAPEIAATARLDQSTIGGQKYLGASAALAYRKGRADLEAVIQQDQLHRLDASASLPATLGWAGGWRFQMGGNISARARSEGLSIAFLNAFSGKSVKGIGGELALDVQARGAVADPTLEGSVRLRDGRLTPVALGIEVSSINADGLLEKRGIRVAQITASANGGKLSGGGFIGVEKFSPQTLDLTLTANRWPAIKTQQYQADVNGAIKVAGSLSAPKVAGKIEVVRAELRPDLAFLKHHTTPLTRDPTIKVVGSKAPTPASLTEEKSVPTNNNLWQSAALEVQVTAPNNVWLRHANANVELSGNLKLEKSAGGNLGVIGRLEAVRGWVGFQGRRFNVTRGVVTLDRGDKLNPTLDVVGEYRAGEHVINVIISGNAEKPTLTLASQPQMEQSDILAVLLFGKPMAALNQGEALSLQQNAISLASGFAAGPIVKAISQALGLQQLGLDVSDIEVTEGRVRVGRYVGDKTFFSVSQQITGNYGQEVSIEFRVTKDLRLGVSSTSEGTGGVDLIWHKRY